MNFDQIINRKQTASLKWDKNKERFGKEDLLPLWVADMDFKAPQPVLDAIKRRVEHGIFGYSFVPDSTYDAIIHWINKRYQWSINKEWIDFSHGVVPAISTIVNTFTEPGDEIIIQSPVYYPFFSQVEKNGRKLVNNQLIEKNGTYAMDFEHLEKSISEKTKMLILSHPHNPVGRVWTREELTQLGEICVKHNILVISDEIHCDLTFKGIQHIPFASISKEFADISITCMAPSKTFNLAGLQTSYLIIPNKKNRIKYKEALGRQGLSEPNIIGITAMEAAYRYGEGWLNELMTYIQSNLIALTTFIEKELPSLKVIQPEAMYLVWIDARKLGVDHKELESRIINKGNVALNQGYIFGKSGEGFIRVNIACPQETLMQGLKQIKNALS